MSYAEHCIVFWWQIFFRKHGKSTPQRSGRPPCFGRRGCDDDVTMQVHQSSQPITRCKAWQPRAGSTVDRFWTGCHVDAMSAIWQNHIGKNIQITFKLRPSIHNRIANLFMEAWTWWRYKVGTILLEIYSAPFFLKTLGPLNCTFTRILTMHINLPKIVLRSGKFQILFWRLYCIFYVLWVGFHWVCILWVDPTN